jgi:hypothetical protein
VLAGVGQLFRRVGPDCLQHRVAGLAVCGRNHDQGLVDQASEQVDDPVSGDPVGSRTAVSGAILGADLLDRVEAGSAGRIRPAGAAAPARPG